MGASAAGIHAGFYYQGVQASYAGDANHLASGGSGALVVSQVGQLTYAGTFYVTDTTAPTIKLNVSQNVAGSDPQRLDFAQIPAYVQVSVSGPGGSFQSTALITDAADFASTGDGAVAVSLPALPDGAYSVTASFVPGYWVLDPSVQFMVGEDARGALTSSQTQRGYASGGGAIAADPSANTADTRGYFGFDYTPGRSPQGNFTYSYRARMDVGGGLLREVDVVVMGSDVDAVSGNPRTATVSGHFSVAFVDALTGAHYSALEFSGGSFTLTAATKNGDTFALALYRPDGTLFHATAPLNHRGQVAPAAVVEGSIVCTL
ncbi:MAG: hypothetical protein JOY80_00680 [Candidatus Dormibacteraeota bacterium]|nr:hypothetical protein [Candidatus Dormibacteraeota bacterium]